MKKLLLTLFISISLYNISLAQTDEIIGEKNSLFNNMLYEWISNYKPYTMKDDSKFEKLEFHLSDTINVSANDKTYLSLRIDNYVTKEYLMEKAKKVITEMKKNNKFIKCKTANVYTEFHIDNYFSEFGIDKTVINYNTFVLLQ